MLLLYSSSGPASGEHWWSCCSVCCCIIPICFERHWSRVLCYTRKKTYIKIPYISIQGLTCDIDLFKKMNAVRSPYRKSNWYKAFKFDADRENLMSEMNEENHVKMRNRVAAGVRYWMPWKWTISY